MTKIENKINLSVLSILMMFCIANSCHSAFFESIIVMPESTRYISNSIISIETVKIPEIIDMTGAETMWINGVAVEVLELKAPVARGRQEAAKPAAPAAPAETPGTRQVLGCRRSGSRTPQLRAVVLWQTTG